MQSASPSQTQLEGLINMSSCETWASMPEDLAKNPCLYSPGIKWDVSPGSFTHLTELFGPVLGVMPYSDLSEAIDLVHQTGYGLTSGLESLDDREQQEWSSRLQAGNLYINRPTTGAIVLRQPFGGMGKSAFGPGIKAGGPNYVVPLMHIASTEPDPNERAPAPEITALSVFWQQLATSRTTAAKRVRELLGEENWTSLKYAISNYDRFASSQMRKVHDTLKLVGQDNLRKYVPMTHVRIRIHPDDSWFDLVARAAAVVAAGGRATVSYPSEKREEDLALLEELTQEWAGDMEFVLESDEDLVRAIQDGQVDRLRYAKPEFVPIEVRKAADDQFVYVADSPVSTSGRIELLWYVREQSLCVDYHRYGNLGFRTDEERADVL